MSGWFTRLVGFLPPLVLLFAGAAAAPMAQATTQGSGRTATEARSVGDFERIAVAGSLDVQVRQGSKPAVSVTADDNLVPLIETVVEGDTLRVRVKRGERINTRNPIKVQVDVVKLTGLSSAGASDVSIEALKTPLLKLSIAGSGDARLKALEADVLEISVAGSGDVGGNGNVRQLKVSIAGSGDVQIAGIVADDVSVTIAGSGDARVTANKTLAVTVAGSGDVEYRGNATTIKTSVMGSGSITKR